MFTQDTPFTYIMLNDQVFYIYIHQAIKSLMGWILDVCNFYLSYSMNSEVQL